MCWSQTDFTILVQSSSDKTATLLSLGLCDCEAGREGGERDQEAYTTSLRWA